jgi:acetoin utilization deacetylase AcuC-like enzyme
VVPAKKRQKTDRSSDQEEVTRYSHAWDVIIGEASPKGEETLVSCMQCVNAYHTQQELRYYNRYLQDFTVFNQQITRHVLLNLDQNSNLLEAFMAHQQWVSKQNTAAGTELLTQFNEQFNEQSWNHLAQHVLQEETFTHVQQLNIANVIGYYACYHGHWREAYYLLLQCKNRLQAVPFQWWSTLFEPAIYLSDDNDQLKGQMRHLLEHESQAHTEETKPAKQKTIGMADIGMTDTPSSLSSSSSDSDSGAGSSSSLSSSASASPTPSESEKKTTHSLPPTVYCLDPLLTAAVVGPIASSQFGGVQSKRLEVVNSSISTEVKQLSRNQLPPLWQLMLEAIEYQNAEAALHIFNEHIEAEDPLKIAVNRAFVDEPSLQAWVKHIASINDGDEANDACNDNDITINNKTFEIDVLKTWALIQPGDKVFIGPPSHHAGPIRAHESEGFFGPAGFCTLPLILPIEENAHICIVDIDINASNCGFQDPESDLYNNLDQQLATSSSTLSYIDLYHPNVYPGSRDDPYTLDPQPTDGKIGYQLINITASGHTGEQQQPGFNPSMLMMLEHVKSKMATARKDEKKFHLLIPAGFDSSINEDAFEGGAEGRQDWGWHHHDYVFFIAQVKILMDRLAPVLRGEIRFTLEGGYTSDALSALPECTGIISGAVNAYSARQRAQTRALIHCLEDKKSQESIDKKNIKSDDISLTSSHLKTLQQLLTRGQALNDEDLQTIQDARSYLDHDPSPRNAAAAATAMNLTTPPPKGYLER